MHSGRHKAFICNYMQRVNYKVIFGVDCFINYPCIIQTAYPLGFYRPIGYIIYYLGFLYYIINVINLLIHTQIVCVFMFYGNFL